MPKSYIHKYKPSSIKFGRWYSPIFGPGVRDPDLLHFVSLEALVALAVFPDVGVWKGLLPASIDPGIILSPESTSKLAMTLFCFNCWYIWFFFFISKISRVAMNRKNCKGIYRRSKNCQELHLKRLPQASNHNGPSMRSFTALRGNSMPSELLRNRYKWVPSSHDTTINGRYYVSRSLLDKLIHSCANPWIYN